MTEHTPGPWALRYSLTTCQVFADNDIKLTQKTALSRRFDKAEIATPRLIAAAPDLLAALQAIFPANGPSTHLSDDNIRTATAAIAKATGESQ